MRLKENDLNNLSLVELKASVYDEMLNIEDSQYNIKLLNSILNTKKV